MEIKDFIKSTLKQLFGALSESSDELKKRVKLTNTVLLTAGKGNYGLIEFDLAVQAENTKKSEKEAEVKISVFGS